LRNEISILWDGFHKRLISSKEPLSIIKIGATEALFVSMYLQGTPIKDIPRHDLWLGSGIFCESDSSFEDWCKSYMKAIKQSDFVHLWQDFCFSSHKDFGKHSKNKLTDGFLIDFLKPNLKHTPQSANHDDWLPFFLKEEGWHYSLRDKKVLVVSSAEKSFNHQAKVYDKIWPGAELGGFEFVKVPESELLSGEGLESPLDWKHKLNLVTDKIAEKQFDFAMVGCGGIGLMVIDFIKNRMKKSCTYLGGSLQLFFGIRGKRWEDANWDFYNGPYWICPFEEDIPKNFKNLENGCYWIK